MSNHKQKTLHPLGRGLEAIFPKTSLSAGRTIMQIPVKDVIANTFQPRTVFNQDAIDKLAHSIVKNGLAQPIVVRQSENSYELIAGERRLRACKQAGMSNIPAIIKNVSDEQSLQLALVENLDREDLNAIEVARGYERLIQEFSYTHQDLADLFYKSRSAITNTLRLLQSPKCVVDAIMNGSISEGHARALLGVDSIDEVKRYLSMTITDSLSVRDLEKAISSNKVSRETMPLFEEKNKTIISFEEKFSDMGFRASFKGSTEKGNITLKYKSGEELQLILNRFF